MIEINYYYSTNNRWFFDLAESFSNATGEKIIVRNNKLVFPPTVAKGRYEFYELEDGFSIVLIDCTFFRKLKFHQPAIKGNDNYQVLCNISEAPVILTLQNGEVVDMSNSLAEAVAFSSHTTEGTYCLGINKPVRIVQLIYHSSWGVRHLLHNAIPLGIKRLRQFASYLPMQFVTNLDLKTYQLIKETLSVSVFVFLMPRLLSGYAYQLVSLLFNNIVEEEISEKQHLISDEALRIIQLKEHIEKKLEQDIPTMDKAAEICLMSRTKFAQMFKVLFQKNYGLYFLDLKLKKAKALLERGHSVNDVGRSIGYSNISHFTKAYKEHFGVTPGMHSTKRG